MAKPVERLPLMLECTASVESTSLCSVEGINLVTSCLVLNICLSLFLNATAFTRQFYMSEQRALPLVKDMSRIEV